MKKKLCILFVLVLLMSILGACSSTSTTTTAGSSATTTSAGTSTQQPTTSSGDKIKIGISCCLMQNEFFAAQMAAYDDLLKNPEYSNVEIVSKLDANLDLQADLDNVAVFASKKVDVIIMSLSDFNSAKEIIAAAQGIPIVFTNREPTDTTVLQDGKHTYVGSSEYDGGFLQGEYLGKLLKDRGETAINYICFMGELGAQNAVQRTEGHIAGLEASGLDMNLVLKDAAKWARTEALQKTEQVLGTGKKVNCIVTNNDEMALGAIEAIKAKGISLDDVVVGGMDGVAAALQSMQAGEMKCTVLQNAEGQAKLAMAAAFKIANGEKVDPYYWIPYELITPDNINNYLK